MALGELERASGLALARKLLEPGLWKLGGLLRTATLVFRDKGRLETRDARRAACQLSVIQRVDVLCLSRLDRDLTRSS